MLCSNVGVLDRRRVVGCRAERRGELLQDEGDHESRKGTQDCIN